MPNEASFQLLTTDTWQWLLLCHNTHLCAMAGQCLNVNGDYMDVWRVTPATHVPCIHQCQNNIFCIRVFVTLFSENFLVYYLFVHFKATFVRFKSIFYGSTMSWNKETGCLNVMNRMRLMCVCMCACAYVCVHMHMCVCTHVRMCASTHRMILYIN